jgi:glycosyltransferase involved in cell wall biosynthesis
VKLLVISYFYPPQKGIGGKRVFRLVSRLGALGVEPIVLTTPWPPQADCDMAQATDAPDVIVDRGYVPEWVWRMYHGKTGSEYQPGPLSWFLMKVNQLVGPPIDRKSWFIPMASRRALQLAKEHGVDAVLSSSAPYSSHLVAMRIAEKLQIPFYADLRDPWSFNFVFNHRPRHLRNRDKQVEQRVFAAARGLFFAAKATENKYGKLYPGYKDKFHTIYSGFDRDPSDSAIAEWPKQPRPRVTIAHFGRFYGVRRMDRILSSLDAVVKTQKLSAADIHLLILGDVANADVEQMRAMGLVSYVTISAMMPYEEGLAILRGADVLFLCDYDMEPYFVPGKLFDYLRVRRPILALSANEELRAIVHDTHMGIALHPDDVDGQVRAWTEIIAKGPKEALSFQPNDVALDRLSADDAARQLADVLMRNGCGSIIPAMVTHT